MNDIYLYEDVPVLKNKFGIKDEKTLDLVEAEQSRASMMLLYEHGFHDFSNRGVKKIHRTLFEDVYKWAGNYRVINIIKREPVLAGQSVWYSNAEDIPHDLKCAWDEIHQVEWISLSKEDFAKEIAHKFPKIWRVHPFREGNTRTVVMLMTFFVEHYGYYFDQELLAQSAEYVRDALVMACLDNYSEMSIWKESCKMRFALSQLQKLLQKNNQQAYPKNIKNTNQSTTNPLPMSMWNIKRKTPIQKTP